MRTSNEFVFQSGWMLLAVAGMVMSSPGCGGGQATSASPSAAAVPDSSGVAGMPAAAPPSAPSAASAAATPSSPGSSAAAGAAGAPSESTVADRGINDIRAVIAANRDRFRACYDQSLKQHAGIEGKFVLHFVLHPNGSLKSADVDKAASQILTDDMGPCSIAVLKSLKFAPSKKGMESTVNYPFEFHPKGPAKMLRRDPDPEPWYNATRGSVGSGSDVCLRARRIGQCELGESFRCRIAAAKFGERREHVCSKALAPSLSLLGLHKRVANRDLDRS